MCQTLILRIWTASFPTVMLFGKLANLGDDISDSYKEDVATFKR